MSVGSPTAGTWSSSPWRLDNEFEMDRRGSADRAAVDGGRGPLNGRLVGHYGPIIPRFASVSGPHPARRQAPRRPTPRDPAASAEPATAPPKTTQIATGGAGGRYRRRRPDARRHATLLQSRIQRENWEFETHSRRRVGRRGHRDGRSHRGHRRGRRRQGVSQQLDARRSGAARRTDLHRRTEPGPASMAAQGRSPRRSPRQPAADPRPTGVRLAAVP